MRSQWHAITHIAVNNELSGCSTIEGDSKPPRPFGGVLYTGRHAPAPNERRFGYVCSSCYDMCSSRRNRESLFRGPRVSLTQQPGNLFATQAAIFERFLH